MTSQRVSIDTQLETARHFSVIEKGAPGRVKTMRSQQGRPLYWCHGQRGEPWRWNNLLDKWECLA